MDGRLDGKLDGKLLRVNLTSKEFTVEKIPYEEKLKLLGVRGLGVLLLYRD